MRKAFIITIDTEGDNLWSRPREIRTENTRFIPRFQTLCEKIGFYPVYLTNFEMAMDDAFVEFGRDAARRGTAEIGMHLHAWNSPPIKPLMPDDFDSQPFLIEYPVEVMREKIAFMTDILQSRFGMDIISHRAGRWGFNATYARLLKEYGYRVDCSVTPGTRWRSRQRALSDNSIVDYRNFPTSAYFVGDEIGAPHSGGGLLEVPMTSRRGALYGAAPWLYRAPGLAKLARKIDRGFVWLRPNGRNLRQMLSLVDDVEKSPCSHLEFMLHSSELMPGGSPTFRDAGSVEKLYQDLESLFARIADGFTGATLKSFLASYAGVKAAER